MFTTSKTETAGRAGDRMHPVLDPEGCCHNHRIKRAAVVTAVAVAAAAAIVYKTITTATITTNSTEATAPPTILRATRCHALCELAACHGAIVMATTSTTAVEDQADRLAAGTGASTVARRPTRRQEHRLLSRRQLLLQCPCLHIKWSWPKPCLRSPTAAAAAAAAAAADHGPCHESGLRTAEVGDTGDNDRCQATS